jgi:aspartate 1-decarboxylase
VPFFGGDEIPAFDLAGERGRKTVVVAGAAANSQRQQMETVLLGRW